MRQATPPAAEIQSWGPVCFARSALAPFTAAKISRNPALPKVAMLLGSNTLATNTVRPAVINAGARLPDDDLSRPRPLPTRDASSRDQIASLLGFP